MSYSTSGDSHLLLLLLLLSTSLLCLPLGLDALLLGDWAANGLFGSPGQLTYSPLVSSTLGVSRAVSMKRFVASLHVDDLGAARLRAAARLRLLLLYKYTFKLLYAKTVFEAVVKVRQAA